MGEHQMIEFIATPTGKQSRVSVAQEIERLTPRAEAERLFGVGAHAHGEKHHENPWIGAGNRLRSLQDALKAHADAQEAHRFVESYRTARDLAFVPSDVAAEAVAKSNAIDAKVQQSDRALFARWEQWEGSADGRQINGRNMPDDERREALLRVSPFNGEELAAIAEHAGLLKEQHDLRNEVQRLNNTRISYLRDRDALIERFPALADVFTAE